MAQDPAAWTTLLCLHRRVALSIALEEDMVAAMSRFLAGMGDGIPPDEVREIEQFIRSHRVGLIKNRAIMAAHGIDV